MHLFISSLFLQVLLFHHWFLSGIFVSPTFFTITVFLSGTSFFVFALEVLQIWQIFRGFLDLRGFTLRRFLPYTPSQHLAQRDVAPTCFYQGFPMSQQFFLESYRTSLWSSKHRPSPSSFLNHTVASKRC